MKHVLTSTQHRVLKLYIITLQIYYIIYIHARSRFPRANPTRTPTTQTKIAESPERVQRALLLL